MIRGGNNLKKYLSFKMWFFLTVVNTFSYTFYEKYFLLFVIPPFHLCVIIALTVRRLRMVELRVEYGWNYMKFHP